MSVTKLDAETKTYFLEQGREIGFVKECINSHSLREKAEDSGPPVEQCADCQFDGLTAKVYSLPARSVDVFTAGDDGPSVTTAEARFQCEGGFTDCEHVAEDIVVRGDELFVADVSESSDRTPGDYSTYVFDSRPSEESLTRAHTIQTLKHELCFGDLAPTFVCRECGRQTHWLTTPRDRADPLSVRPEVKLRNLRQHVCCGDPA